MIWRVTGRIDYAGALAAVVFLTGITFAFIEAPTLGWSSPSVIAMTAVGVVGLAAFLVREHTAASPMLPLSIFAERQFAATNAVTFIVYAALTGATFLLPVMLQIVSGYSVAAVWPAPVTRGGASRPQWRHSSGAGAPAGRAARLGLVIVNAASTPPAAHVAPEMSAAVRNPAASASGCR